MYEVEMIGKLSKGIWRNKKAVISEWLLTHFNSAAEIIIAPDASERGIRAVLLHTYEDGNMKAVVHASHLLI